MGGTGIGRAGDVGVVTNVTSSAINIIAENNNSSGMNTITRHSPTSWSINSASGSYYYTNFSWFLP